MTRTTLKTTALLITLTLCGLTASARGDDAELKKLRDENAALKAKVQQLEAELAKLRQSNTRLAAEKQQIVAAQVQKQAQSDAYFVEQVTDEKGGKALASRSMEMKATYGTRDTHVLSMRSAPGASSVTLTVRAFETSGVYGSLDTVLFTADGKEINAKVTAYDIERRTVGSPKSRRRADNETLVATLSTAELATLAAAKEVEIKIGPSRFAMTDEQRTAFGVMTRMIAGN
ncbi:MAG: hypothetical protein GC159_22830 [Phycisphaera sp.]|nr:hypothetical protein [Phycisphaera sp.]